MIETEKSQKIEESAKFRAKPISAIEYRKSECCSMGCVLFQVWEEVKRSNWRSTINGVSKD